MERVIVEVLLEGEQAGRDLELPPNLPVEQLAPLVAQALSWPAHQYEIEARPPGRPLRPDETLAEAQAWDGAVLIFRQRAAQAAPQQPAGFAWKRLS